MQFKYAFMPLIFAVTSINPVQADTTYDCTINALKGNGVTMGAQGVNCSANVVYVNTLSGEQQELNRSCKIVGKRATTCQTTSNDADVLVGFPRIAAFRDYSRAAHIHRFARKGCVQGLADLVSGSDDFGNHQISVTQSLTCP